MDYAESNVNKKMIFETIKIVNRQNKNNKLTAVLVISHSKIYWQNRILNLLCDVL